MTGTDRYAVDDLIVEAMDAVAAGRDLPLRAVIPTLERMLWRPNFLPRRFTTSPSAEKPHGVFLVFRAPDDSFTMLTGLWPPGASTDIHDHSGNWCVDAVVEGRLEITRYRQIGDAQPGTRARLEVMDELSQGPGEVVELIPGENDIHQVRNDSGRLVVTFHINAFDLVKVERFRFEPDTGEVSRRIHPSLYDNVPPVVPEDAGRPVPVTAGSRRD